MTPYDDVLHAIKSADLRDIQSAVPAALAKAFEDQVCAELTALGWEVQRQVPLEDRGDGKRGYLDMAARRACVCVAIELDATFPRDKSVWKLRHFAEAHEGPIGAALRAAGLAPTVYRVIGLRKGHRALSLPDGIDALCTNVPPRCYGRKKAHA